MFDWSGKNGDTSEKSQGILISCMSGNPAIVVLMALELKHKGSGCSSCKKGISFFHPGFVNSVIFPEPLFGGNILVIYI